LAHKHQAIGIIIIIVYIFISLTFLVFFVTLWKRIAVAAGQWRPRGLRRPCQGVGRKSRSPPPPSKNWSWDRNCIWRYFCVVS